jgi:dihydroxy-acid dehydratase
MSAPEHIPEKPRYIDFPSIPHGTLRDGKPVLNRWSATLTNGHDFPGAQVCLLRTAAAYSQIHESMPNTTQAMLYAAGVPNRDMMKTAPHVGISTVWWEGNPCK